MAQTYQCDICQETSADFMITNISDGRVVAVGIECLPVWALPMAAGWAELVIDKGGEPPEWAPVIIDAYRQLSGADSGAPEPAQEAPEAPDTPEDTPEPLSPQAAAEAMLRHFQGQEQEGQEVGTASDDRG